MPKEPEPRVDVDLSIRVFGLDAQGHPFSQKAQARNISQHGAKLAGLDKQLKPGDVVGVQYGEQKARCKVIWVVDAGEVQRIEAGVKMVEGQPCPWQKEIATTVPPEGTARSEPAKPKAKPKEDKRKFPRQRVPFPLEIRDPQGVGAPMKTRAADVNGRGCYVETMLPLPTGKILSVTLWLDAKKVTTPAIVRTCDGGVGMGIEFTGLDLATQERLQQEVDTMAAESKPKNVKGAF